MSDFLTQKLVEEKKDTMYNIGVAVMESYYTSNTLASVRKHFLF